MTVMAETKVEPKNAEVKFPGKPKMPGKKRLPPHAKKLAKRGLISEKQMAKMRGEG